jgi:hypothetical protein
VWKKVLLADNLLALVIESLILGQFRFTGILMVRPNVCWPYKVLCRHKFSQFVPIFLFLILHKTIRYFVRLRCCLALYFKGLKSPMAFYQGTV